MSCFGGLPSRQLKRHYRSHLHGVPVAKLQLWVRSPKDPSGFVVNSWFQRENDKRYRSSNMASALVIVSHPDPKSLNHALAAAVRDTWVCLGYPTVLVDLHQIGFDPVMSIAEARGCLSSELKVREQIDLLLKCDLLAIVHPNCWGCPPAMMKGWMDRVFAPGAAYAFAKGADDGSAPVGLFKGKRALVLNTSNTTWARELTSFGDPLERIWKDCLLGYSGIDVIHREVFRVVATSTDDERRGWLLRTVALAESLARGSMGNSAHGEAE